MFQQFSKLMIFSMQPLLQHRHINRIEITYTTYYTTHADYLPTLHIITYTSYRCDSYTLQTNL